MTHNRLTNSFSTGLNHFTFPSAVSENSCCSAFPVAFSIASLLELSHYNRYMLVSRCFCLLLHNDVWSASFHMPVCYLYIFFGELLLQIFCLLYRVLSLPFYILDTTLWSDTYFPSIFSQFVACLFINLKMSFTKKYFLNLI